MNKSKLLLWDGDFVEQVRQRIVNGDAALQPAAARLRRDADYFMKDNPSSVMGKKQMPPSGDKHDYMSLAGYWWPNPATADGMPWVYRDGEYSPTRDSDQFDLGSLTQMYRTVRFLGPASYLLGDEAYNVRAAQWLRTWFIDPATRMNPNLRYAQAVPGQNDGTYFGIIETVDLLDILDVPSFLSPAVWNEDDQRNFKSWFRAYLGWLKDSPNGKAEAAAENNHGAWYDAQVVGYALFTGDRELATKLLKTSVPGRIKSQIQPDGRQPLELSRTRSLGYSLYNLQAYITLAILGEQVGVDLWNFTTPDGRSIRKALEFVTPHLSGQKKWPYPDITKASDVSWFGYWFRRAAVRYNEKDFSEAAKMLLPDQADRINLLSP